MRLLISVASSGWLAGWLLVTTLKVKAVELARREKRAYLDWGSLCKQRRRFPHFSRAKQDKAKEAGARLARFLDPSSAPGSRIAMAAGSSQLADRQTVRLRSAGARPRPEA